MPNEEKCSTGIEALDKILKGGFFRGSTTLLSGHPGVGKTTFAAQFIYDGLLKGENGVYVSFVENKKEFYRHMNMFNMNFSGFEQNKKFVFIEAAPPPTIADLESFISSIFEIVYKHQAKRLVVDSVSPLLAFTDVYKARILLHNTLIKPLKNLGVTMLFIIDLPYGKEDSGYGFEEFLADNVLKMLIKEEKGRLKRYLILSKIRESPVIRIAYEFIIHKNGIKLLIPRETYLIGSYSLKRVSTGVLELDNMLGGGVTQGSVTLISGQSGVGKTILAMLFAVNGALKNEKVVFMSLEESEEQILTLMKSFNINIEKVRDNLRIVSVITRLLTPVAMYAYIEDLVTEEKPNRFIIDGLDSLEKTFREEEYLEFARSVITLFKEKGITAYITSLKNIMEKELTGISTLSDNIIALWFEKEENKLVRKLAVIKTRGSIHDCKIKTVRFEPGKMLLL